MSADKSLPLKMLTTAIHTSICSEMIPHTTVDALFDTRVSCLEFAPKKCTFTEWVSMGKKYVHLATGGSIYILVLLSGLQLRCDVTKASHKTLTTVAEYLINPELAKQGKTSSMLKLMNLMVISR